MYLAHTSIRCSPPLAQFSLSRRRTLLSGLDPWTKVDEETDLVNRLHFLSDLPGRGDKCFAITISEYRSNIETARRIVSEMYTDLDERDVTSSAPFHPAKLKALRELLPADVEITTANGEQAASNQWLHADLDEFVTSDTDIKRLTILGGIYERLTAIQWQLSEYENAGNTDRSKDANKKALAEILEQEQFQKPTGDEKSLIERLIESILRFFAEMFPRSASSGEPIQSSPALARTLQVLIILVVAALVLFVVYKLAPHVFPSLRRRKKQDLDDRVILGEKIDSDRTSHDLMREAELLAQQGDNRAAVRKGYIALRSSLANAV